MSGLSMFPAGVASLTLALAGNLAGLVSRQAGVSGLWFPSSMGLMLATPSLPAPANRGACLALVQSRDFVKQAKIMVSIVMNRKILVIWLARLLTRARGCTASAGLPGRLILRPATLRRDFAIFCFAKVTGALKIFAISYALASVLV